MFNRKFPFPEAHFFKVPCSFFGDVCPSDSLIYSPDSPVFFVQKVYVFPARKTKTPTKPKTHQKTASLHGGFLKWWYPISHPKIIIFNRKTPWVCWVYTTILGNTIMEKPNEKRRLFFEATSLDHRPPWMLQPPWCRMQCCKHSVRTGGRRCQRTGWVTSGTGWCLRWGAPSCRYKWGS